MQQGWFEVFSTCTSLTRCLQPVLWILFTICSLTALFLSGDMLIDVLFVHSKDLKRKNPLDVAFILRLAVTWSLGALFLQLKDSTSYQKELAIWRSHLEGHRTKNLLIFIPFAMSTLAYVVGMVKEGFPLAKLEFWDLQLYLFALCLVWTTMPFYVFLHVAAAEVQQVRERLRGIQEGRSASEVSFLQRDYLALCESMRQRCQKLDSLSALIVLDVFLSGCITLSSVVGEDPSAEWAEKLFNSQDLFLNPIPPLLCYALFISWRCESLASDAQRLVFSLSVERRQSFVEQPEHMHDLLRFIQLVRAMPTGWSAYGARVDFSLSLKAISPLVVAILKRAWSALQSTHERSIPFIGATLILFVAALACWLMKKELFQVKPDQDLPHTQPSSTRETADS